VADVGVPEARERARRRVPYCVDDVAERPYSHPVATGWYAEDVPALLAELARAVAEAATLRTRLVFEEHRHAADVKILSEGARGHDFCSCVLIGKPCDEAVAGPPAQEPA
jgi:hypothetical protein